MPRKRPAPGYKVEYDRHIGGQRRWKLMTQEVKPVVLSLHHTPNEAIAASEAAWQAAAPAGGPDMCLECGEREQTEHDDICEHCRRLEQEGSKLGLSHGTGAFER